VDVPLVGTRAAEKASIQFITLWITGVYSILEKNKHMRSFAFFVGSRFVVASTRKQNKEKLNYFPLFCVMAYGACIV
jgi:hypothetical protein